MANRVVIEENIFIKKKLDLNLIYINVFLLLRHFIYLLSGKEENSADCRIGIVYSSDIIVRCNYDILKSDEGLRMSFLFRLPVNLVNLVNNADPEGRIECEFFLFIHSHPAPFQRSHQRFHILHSHDIICIRGRNHTLIRTRGEISRFAEQHVHATLDDTLLH